MDFKRIAKNLLAPPLGMMILLLPVATVFLIYSMIFLGTKSIVAILSYVLSFYTLAVWCLKIPNLVRRFKGFKEQNRFAKIWKEDVRLRMRLSLYASMIWNTAYGSLQLGLGFWHRSFWFFSLAAYYIALALMRFFLARHTTRHAPGERMRAEWIRYRMVGILFLMMNLTLAMIIFFMVYWGRTFHHHEITTIALSAFTFGGLAKAIVNVVRYRRYNSPVYSASKAISLASAAVSMLTLESTMLTTFENGTMSVGEQKLLLGLSGGAISLFVILMAISMIRQGTEKLKQLKIEENKLEHKETFHYTYSAKVQEEIKSIRKKYAAPEQTEDKLAQLRRLDEGATQKATILSLVIGIVGALILGSGMSLIMTEIGSALGLSTGLSLLAGIPLGLVGILLVSLAYPLYNRTLKKERERIAPEILRLTDELMQ